MDFSKTKKCKTCGKPETEKYRPFCSARCAQIDLGKWLTGSYVIETKEDPDYEQSEEIL